MARPAPNFQNTQFGANFGLTLGVSPWLLFSIWHHSFAILCPNFALFAVAGQCLHRLRLCSGMLGGAMERFEYKVIRATQDSSRFTGLSRANEDFASVLTQSLNEGAAQGWEFLRKEAMREPGRFGLFRRRGRRHDYLVYRRKLRTEGTLPASHETQPRVPASPVPDIERLRARISGVRLAPKLQVIKRR